MPNWDPAILSIFNKIKNKEPLYKVISGDVLHAVEKNFDTEGSRLGKPWPQLDPKYLEQKRKKKRSLNILQSSGAALRSLNRIHSGEFAGVYFPPATARYMATHIFGLTINYPARSETFKRLRSKSGRFKKLRPFEERGITQGATYGAHSVKFKVRNPFQLNESDYNKIENRILDYVTGK